MNDPHLTPLTPSPPEDILDPNVLVIEDAVLDAAGASVESLLAGAPIKGTPLSVENVDPHALPRVDRDDVDGAPEDRALTD